MSQNRRSVAKATELALRLCFWTESRGGHNLSGPTLRSGCRSAMCPSVQNATGNTLTLLDDVSFQPEPRFSKKEFVPRE